MTWEFGREKNFNKLLACEQALEALFRRCPSLQGICQYHARTLPAGLPMAALSLHQSCFINATLSRLNQWYGRDRREISSSDVKCMLARA
jgi:hypothetical protein